MENKKDKLIQKNRMNVISSIRKMHNFHLKYLVDDKYLPDWLSLFDDQIMYLHSELAVVRKDDYKSLEAKLQPLKMELISGRSSIRVTKRDVEIIFAYSEIMKKNIGYIEKLEKLL